MKLKELIKNLQDMQLLYKDAIVCVDIDGKVYNITSMDGYTGIQRPGECKDPNVIVIKGKL